MKLHRLLIVFVALAMVSPVLAGDQPADNMNIVREAMQAEKKLFVAENMGLTQVEADKFWPIYTEYQASLKKLGDRAIKLIEKFAENYESMNDKVAESLISESMSIEKARIELRETYLPKFSAALPATKVARYYQLENKINAVIEFDMATQIPVVPVGKE